MGKYDGKHLTGLIGPLVIRKGPKGQIIQTKPPHVKQTKGTKLSSSLMGKASTLAKTFRDSLYTLHRNNYDGPMVNRMLKEVRAVVNHCYDQETKKFNFTEDSFSRLAGFQFNLKSLLANVLWVSPEMALTGNTLKISIPEIEIPTQLKFPNYANVCNMKVAVAFLVLDQALQKPTMVQAIEIRSDQANVPAQEFAFNVPDGCLCIAGISLDYFKMDNDIKTVLNSKTFNPAGIIDAVITPGTFVIPPTGSTTHKSKASEWQDIFDLKL